MAIYHAPTKRGKGVQMKAEIFTRGEPPERVYKGFIRRAKPDYAVQCSIISPVFWGCYVHWHGRSVPCARDTKQCPCCKLGYPRKWLGYLYIRNERNGKYEHFELPLDAGHDLLDLIGGTIGLRGTRLLATRVGAKTGRIQFDLKERMEIVAPSYELPEDKAPDEILEYLWNINRVKLHLSLDTELPERGVS